MKKIFEKSNKFQNEIKHDEVQISFNKYINNSFEEKYNLEFFKDNYFKNDIWKKNEFIKIVKRFKSCEGTYLLSNLKYQNF